MSLVNVLVTVGLISAFLITGGLGYDKLMSDRGTDALQQARDSLADRLSTMEDEGQPGYKIRHVQATLSAMDKMLRRAKSDEKILLDKKGRAATKEALINLVKGAALNDILSLGDLALDTMFKLSDAHAGTRSAHQKRLSDKIAALRSRLEGAGSGSARPLQGDDLDFFIAAAELQHITKVVKEEHGIAESDPAFVNVLKRYLDDYYIREGERPLPADIRTWVDTIVEAQHGDDAPAPEKDSSRYLVFMRPWPTYGELGFERSDIWGNYHRYDGILHVGLESDVRMGLRYADDPVMLCLMRNQAEFIPDKHGVDADRLAQQVMSYYPVMAEGSTSVPTFASQEEATKWLCGRLRSTHRVETHDAYKGCPAFTGATTTNGTRVILGNVSFP